MRQTKTDPESVKNRARTKAGQRLREAHLDEWNALFKEELAAVGIEWEPPLTEEQKAQKQLDELLSKHPNLRNQVVQNEIHTMRTAVGRKLSEGGAKGPEGEDFSVNDYA